MLKLGHQITITHAYRGRPITLGIATVVEAEGFDFNPFAGTCGPNRKWLEYRLEWDRRRLKGMKAPKKGSMVRGRWVESKTEYAYFHQPTGRSVAEVTANARKFYDRKMLEQTPAFKKAQKARREKLWAERHAAREAKRAAQMEA